MFEVYGCAGNLSGSTYKVLVYSWQDFVDGMPLPGRPSLNEWIIISCGMPI